MLTRDKITRLKPPSPWRIISDHFNIYDRNRCLNTLVTERLSIFQTALIEGQIRDDLDDEHS